MSASNIVEYWVRELNSADKRWSAFREQATRIQKIYEAETRTQNDFNILYSNTETLLPSLYNVTPRPIVSRRFKDDNKLARIAGKVLERGLAYHVDTPDPIYDGFDANMESATLGSLVPGFGLTKIKYDVDFQLAMGEKDDEDGSDKAKAIEKKGNEDNSGDDMEPVEDSNPPPEAVSVDYEVVCGEQITFDRVLFGPGQRWSQIPWVAFYHAMTRRDAEKAFGAKVADQLSYTVGDGRRTEKEEDEKRPSTDRGMAAVWEIWHRTTKKVYFIEKTYLDGPLKEPIDDPLKLQGFYPCPEPLVLFSRVGNFIPKPLYVFYENQAKELNRISNRINRIIEALKIRGYYGGGIQNFTDILQKEENTLTALKNQGMAVDGFDINKYIWLFPVEKLITVLQQLYIQREQCKRVIYEVTGISDIIRGSTVASETATAQSIKNQWGTLRLKKMQKRVQRYVRNYLRLVGEVMAKQFSPETWAGMTGLQLPTAQQKQMAVQALQQLQQQGQQPPAPGGPPPSQPDPKMVEAASMPSWEEVLKFLQTDLLRNYTIDIETNSTVEPDAVEDQEQIAKLLGAISNMFSSMGPAVQQGALPMAGFKAILLAVSRRFRFGDEVEDILSQIPDQIPQQGQDKGKEAETQAKTQLIQAETQGKLKVMDKEIQVKSAELDLAAEELQLKREELALKRAELETKKQASAIKSEGIIAAAKAKTMAAQMAAAPQPQAPQGANPGQVPPGAGVPANAPV